MNGDFDEVDDAAHALDLGGDRLGELLQVMGRQAPLEVDGPVVDIA